MYTSKGQASKALVLLDAHFYLMLTTCPSSVRFTVAHTLHTCGHRDFLRSLSCRAVPRMPAPVFLDFRPSHAGELGRRRPCSCPPRHHTPALAAMPMPCSCPCCMRLRVSRLLAERRYHAKPALAFFRWVPRVASEEADWKCLIGKPISNANTNRHPSLWEAVSLPVRLHAHMLVTLAGRAAAGPAAAPRCRAGPALVPTAMVMISAAASAVSSTIVSCWRAAAISCLGKAFAAGQHGEQDDGPAAGLDDVGQHRQLLAQHRRLRDHDDGRQWHLAGHGLVAARLASKLAC
jgi:hypothetical protein